MVIPARAMYVVCALWLGSIAVEAITARGAADLDSNTHHRDRRSFGLKKLIGFDSLETTTSAPPRPRKQTWKVHKYHGIELRPIPNPPFEPTVVPVQEPDEYKFPFAFLNKKKSTPHQTYGVPQEEIGIKLPFKILKNKQPIQQEAPVTSYGTPAESYYSLPEPNIALPPQSYVQTTKTIKFPFKKFPKIEISSETKNVNGNGNISDQLKDTSSATALDALDNLETLSNLGNLLPASITDNIDLDTVSSVLEFLNSKNTDSQTIDISALLQLTELVPSFDLSSPNIDLQSLISLIPNVGSGKHLGPFSKKEHPKLLVLLKVLKSLKAAEIVKLGTILGLRRFHNSKPGFFSKIGSIAKPIVVAKAIKTAKLGLVRGSLIASKGKVGPLKALGAKLGKGVKSLATSIVSLPSTLKGFVGLSGVKDLISLPNLGLALPSVPKITIGGGYKLKKGEGGPYVKISYPQKSKTTTPPPTPYPYPPAPIAPYPEPRYPTTSYGSPVVPQQLSASYEVPQLPKMTYEPPEPPRDTYGPPQKPLDTYGPPEKPMDTYGPPEQPMDTYGPPQKPLETYGAPEQPMDTYGPPQKPLETYGTPKQPKDTYGPPQKPKDTYGPPEQPKDTYETPQQELASVNEPPKVYEVPQQTYAVPQQIYEVPKQAYQVPQQAYEVPQQTYEVPQQTYAVPQQTYEVPKQTYQVPQQAYDIPQQTYEVPKQTYEVPKQTYQVPQQPYEIPQQTYEVPQQTYEVPKQTYQVPQQAYEIPQQTYEVPQQTYEVPKQTYQVPQQAHEVPQQAYVAPQHTYQIPHQVYKVPQYAYQLPPVSARQPHVAQLVRVVPQFSTGVRVPLATLELPQASRRNSPVYRGQQYADDTEGAFSEDSAVATVGEVQDMEDHQTITEVDKEVSITPFSTLELIPRSEPTLANNETLEFHNGQFLNVTKSLIPIAQNYSQVSSN